MKYKKMLHGCIISIFVTLVFFLLLEFVLFLIGYRYFILSIYDDPGIMLKMHGKYVFLPFVYDPQSRFWIADSKNEFINDFGFRGSQIKPEKDCYRIVCMGDSCVFVGNVPYSERLSELLNKSGLKKYEVINAGVIGYDSSQGLRLLKEKIIKLKPDLITVCYGWNDHVIVDTENKLKVDLCNMPKAIKNIYKTRTGQLCRNIYDKFIYSHFKNRARVPLDMYKKNIEQIITVAKRNNVKMILLTAASGIVYKQQNYKYGGVEKEKVLYIHEEYNNIVREIAKNANIPLLDLSRLFDEKYKSYRYFWGDGVHYSEASLQIIAENILNMLVDMDILTSAEANFINNYIDSFEYNRMVGKELYDECEFTGSMPYLKKAYEKNKKDKELENIFKHIENKMLAEDKLESGMVLANKGMYEEALAKYKDAIASVPDFSIRYIEIGSVLVALGRYSEAADSFNKVINAGIHDTWVYEKLAKIYLKQGMYNEAAENFEALIKIRPNYLNGYINLGEVYEKMSLYDKAANCYSNAIKIYSEYVVAYVKRGNVYAKIGRYLDAVSDFSMLIKLEPWNAEAYNNRGCVYYSMSEYKKAERDFNKAVRYGKKYAQAYYNRGLLYFEIGKTQKALKDFSAAIGCQENYYDAYAARAQVYNKLGEHEKANEDIRIAKKIKYAEAK